MKVLRNLWTVVATKCREADRVASVASADPEATTASERIGAFFHRMVCRSCRNAWQQIHSIDQALQMEEECCEHPTEQLDDEARKRIAEKIRDPSN